MRYLPYIITQVLLSVRFHKCNIENDTLIMFLG